MLRISSNGISNALSGQDYSPLLFTSIYIWGECRSPSKSLDHSLPHSIYADSPEAAFFAAAFAMVGQAKLHLFFYCRCFRSAKCMVYAGKSYITDHEKATFSSRSEIPFFVCTALVYKLYSYVFFLLTFARGILVVWWHPDEQQTGKRHPKFSNPMLPCSLKPKRISTIKNLFFPWFSHRLKKSNRSELSFVSTAGSIVALCDLAQWFVRFADRFIWLEK